MKHINRIIVLVAGLSVVLGLLVPGIVFAEDAAPPADQDTSAISNQDAAPAAPDQALFSKEQLDQILAPIALYPDPLLTQIFIASTYPLEVVQATRWAEDQKKKGLKPDQIATEAAKQSWDPSVQALTAFPQVLDMMNTKLDWTQKLGDAVLAQQPDVMASVQRLRHQADAAGTLKSSEQVNVVKEEQTIYIEPATPQVIYVPQYNPTVIYGAWPYPGYPPYYYPPPPAYIYPGYDPFAAALGFGLAVGITAAVWHDNWHHHNDYDGGSINIDNSNNNNISGGGNNNGNNNRPGDGNRPGNGDGIGGDRPGNGDGIGGDRPGNGNRPGNRPGNGGKWEHKPEHRKGAEYRDVGSRQKYGGQRGPSASTGDYRGRDQMRNMERSGNFGSAGSMDRSGNFGSANRAGSMDRSNAFQGRGQGGQTRQELNRGQSSRQGMSSRQSGSRSMGSSRSGGSRSMGGSRSGGGRSMGGRSGGGRGGRR